MSNDTDHYVFSITGLAGPGNSARIVRALESVPHVSTASVEFGTGLTGVTMAGGPFDAVEIVRAVEKAGCAVATETMTLGIQGMTCLACAARVQWALADVPGVLAVDVNLSNERAEVEHIAGMAGKAEFRQAVETCGYALAGPEIAPEPAVTSQNPAASRRRRRVFAHALLFVAGFSVIFIVGWGGTATLLGQVFKSYKGLIAQVGGVVVIVFGLSTLGWIRVPWLNYDTRPEWRGAAGKGWLSSAMMGVFFAAGWTPCIGTTLGAILTLGFSGENSTQAMVLSSGYALGMGVPFLAIGLGMEKAAAGLRRFHRFMRAVQAAGGLLMIAIGVMLLTNRLALIAIWAQRNGFFPDFPLGEAVTPTYPIALAAGLISFLSPCVLPLVPAYIGYLSGHALGSDEP